MTTTKEFYTFLNGKFMNLYDALAVTSRQIAELDAKINSKDYTPAAVRVLQNQRREIVSHEKELKHTMLNELQSQSEELKEQFSKPNAIDGANLTDDVRLFNIGVKLDVDDVRAIMDRNSDNVTMLTLALKYMEQNGFSDSEIAKAENGYPALKERENAVRSIESAVLWATQVVNMTGDVESVKVNEPDGSINYETIVPDLYNTAFGEGSLLYSELNGTPAPDPVDDAE